MTFRRAMGRVLCCAALLLGTAGFASAQQPPAPKVDLQLVLAVDVSGSVNQTRFELQKQGYAAAFRNSAALDAIRSGTNQAIAVTMVQWRAGAAFTECWLD